MSLLHTLIAPWKKLYAEDKKDFGNFVDGFNKLGTLLFGGIWVLLVSIMRIVKLVVGIIVIIIVLVIAVISMVFFILFMQDNRIKEDILEILSNIPLHTNECLIGVQSDWFKD